jgi:hypothetical protein
MLNVIYDDQFSLPESWEKSFDNSNMSDLSALFSKSKIQKKVILTLQKIQ